MATIVRVKRRRHEDPLESLVVSCKRKREEQTSAADNDINDSQSSLKFAGTVSSKVIVSYSNFVQCPRNRCR
jgi:hypothetical protein